MIIIGAPGRDRAEVPSDKQIETNDCADEHRQRDIGGNLPEERLDVQRRTVVSADEEREKTQGPLERELGRQRNESARKTKDEGQDDDNPFPLC